jgi:hypothetical protein
MRPVPTLLLLPALLGPLSFAITCLLPCLLAVGCGSAQLVRGDADGGEVILNGSYISAVTEARAVMAEHCNGRFAVYAESTGEHRLLDAPNSDQRRAAFVCGEGSGSMTVAKARP